MSIDLTPLVQAPMALACATLALLGPCLLAGLVACSDLTPEQQTRITQALRVACNVDGVVVPITQPIVATLGAGGATAAGVDTLLVHPAVVAACGRLGGTPAEATPADAH